jgi:hypothetical protein
MASPLWTEKSTLRAYLQWFAEWCDLIPVFPCMLVFLVTYNLRMPSSINPSPGYRKVVRWAACCQDDIFPVPRVDIAYILSIGYRICNTHPPRSDRADPIFQDASEDIGCTICKPLRLPFRFVVFILGKTLRRIFFLKLITRIPFAVPLSLPAFYCPIEAQPEIYRVLYSPFGPDLTSPYARR